MAGILNKQLFSADLQEVLFPDNEHYKNSIKVSSADEDKVNIPLAGGVGAAISNPSYPLTTTTVDDTATFFQNVNHSTPVVAVPDNVEEMVVYNKGGEIRRQFAAILNTTICDHLNHTWAQEAEGAGLQEILKTTGSARRADYTGMSGTRLAITLDDIANARTALDRQDLPNTGARRIAVITPEMHGDLLKIEQVLNRNFNPQAGLLAKGAVMQIYGFDIYVRSKVNAFDSSDALNAVGAAVGVD